MSPYADASDLTIDAEWDNMCDIVETSEELPSSSKAVCKVLEEWISDDESIDMDIMEVDEEIGSKFLCDDLFDEVICPAPISPDDALISSDNFAETFMASYSHGHDNRVDERCREAFFKLQESMKRSQETRMALTMKTEKANNEYIRRQSIAAVLASIEASCRQIQDTFAPAC